MNRTKLYIFIGLSLFLLFFAVRYYDGCSKRKQQAIEKQEQKRLDSLQLVEDAKTNAEITATALANAMQDSINRIKYAKEEERTKNIESLENAIKNLSGLLKQQWQTIELGTDGNVRIVGNVTDSEDHTVVDYVTYTFSITSVNPLAKGDNISVKCNYGKCIDEVYRKNNEYNESTSEMILCGRNDLTLSQLEIYKEAVTKIISGQ